MLKKIEIKHGIYTLVDDDDYEKFKDISWKLTRGYANNTRRGYLHRLILKTDKEVDHINSNPLDNRKCNLREVTRNQNAQNRSTNKQKSYTRYKGVFWDKHRNKWRVIIQKDNKQIFLGRFTNEIDAARAYDIKAKEIFGEYAKLNLEGE
jgi:hypothetical protein